MDIIEGIRSTEEKLNNNIILTAINLTAQQRQVINLNTDERVTVFNYFNSRQMGQTWAAILKALHLSNENGSTILIHSFSKNCSLCAYDECIRILELCNQTDKIIKIKRVRYGTCEIKFKNGSTLLFASIKNEAVSGQRVDYVICDNMELSNQHLLNNLISLTLNNDNGQVFIFPHLHDMIRRGDIECHF